MYLFFLLLWIVFNGKFTWEIAIFGAVFAGVIYWFICRFLNFSIRRDILFCRRTFALLYYMGVLFREIIKANVEVVRMICSSRYVLEPVVVCFQADLKSNFARVMLANSITLTPGTITVSVSGGMYVVHCLDKSLAEGIDRSVFVELLKKIERMG